MGGVVVAHAGGGTPFDFIEVSADAALHEYVWAGDWLHPKFCCLVRRLSARWRVTKRCAMPGVITVRSPQTVSAAPRRDDGPSAERETVHPHDLQAQVPDRVSESDLRRLSQIDAVQAALGIATEWLLIAAAIGLGVAFPHPVVIAILIPFLGARQHALTVIAHDASHFRLFPHRLLNELLGNMLLAWPMFISVEGFRHYHSRHHRHLNTPRDGNRELWMTHGSDDQLTAEWTFPKHTAGLIGVLLFRAAFITGVFWILRGFIGGFFVGTRWWMALLRGLYYAAVAAALTYFDAWTPFLLYWIVPYCTWHLMIQYLRLICEHSAVQSDDPRYAETRTTIPGFLGRLFVLPRNIGYHIEHHWYPSVPFYHLPELHRVLMENANYRRHAQVSHSILNSLRGCVASR